MPGYGVEVAHFGLSLFGNGRRGEHLTTRSTPSLSRKNLNGWDWNGWSSVDSNKVLLIKESQSFRTVLFSDIVFVRKFFVSKACTRAMASWNITDGWLWGRKYYGVCAAKKAPKVHEVLKMPDTRCHLYLSMFFLFSWICNDFWVDIDVFFLENVSSINSFRRTFSKEFSVAIKRRTFSHWQFTIR